MRIFRVGTFLLLILGIFLPNQHISAKEYSIPQIHVDARINADGTVTITEHRTYVFDGNYSWANYKLPKKGYSGISDITVSEATNSFINLNTEEPGTFLIEESDEAYNIKWFYRAEDETRTFTISYTLTNALVIGPEWSEFFWTFAASDREKSTEKLEILIQIPIEITGSDLYSWVREPAWDIITTTLDNGYQFIGTDINRKQAVTIRTVFPTSVFNSEVPVSDPGFSLAIAKQQETEWKEERRIAAENEAYNKSLATEFSIIIIGLSLIIFIYLYRKYGARHKVNLSTNESIMLPGREKPAAIGWLLNNRVVNQGFIMATMLDLARRGYFTINENEADDEGWLASKDPYFTVHLTEKQTAGELADYEQNLYDFISDRIKNEGSKLEEIFNFQDKEVYKWFPEWKKDLKSYCNSKEWIEINSYKGMYINLGLQFILLTGSVIGIFLLHPLMSVPMGISFIMLILSFTIIRRTPKGEELYRRWINYSKALKHAKDYTISDDMVGLHFIYAIAFGVTKSHINSMFEENPAAVSLIYWIVILPGMNSSPADIATSFSNLAATASATAAGGSFGGGASAGAAGGGASGGAG